VDRSRLLLAPIVLSPVSLARGSPRLVLERSGGRLARLGREQDAAGDDDKLEAALEGFYALAALHTGPPARDEGMDRPTLEIATKTAADGGPPREIRISIGAQGRVDAQDVYFARAAGTDATFAVSRRSVTAILDAW